MFLSFNTSVLLSIDLIIMAYGSIFILGVQVNDSIVVETRVDMLIHIIQTPHIIASIESVFIQHLSYCHEVYDLGYLGG